MKAHEQGYLTQQEMKLIQNGLETLALQCSTAAHNVNNPPIVREYAGYKMTECNDLLIILKKMAKGIKNTA